MDSGDNMDQSQDTPANGKHYEWQLSTGGQWQPIANDHVIETHYCQPGAKGIRIHILHRQVNIDFDKLETQTAGVGVQRLRLLPPGQTEDVGWYFRDDRLWREYGSTSSGTSSSSSVSSGDVQRQFALNPRGTFNFTVGSTGYTLDFSTMTQTNCATGLRRNVRKRPKFTSNTGSSVSSSQLPDGGFTWEFMGDEGKWTEYEAHISSFDSAAIETQFQQSPQGRLHFQIGSSSYTLDFSRMCQVNHVFGTERAARRTAAAAGSPHSSSGAGPRWQFQDIDGLWKDYSKGSSVSSQDIELQYQQNPSGTVKFTTNSYGYELDLSAMSQKNMSTSTTRSVRRLQQ